MQASCLTPEQILKATRYKETIKTRVRHYSQAWAYHGIPLPVEELESEALVILAECVSRYDPTRGAKFDTFLWSELGRLKHVAWKIQQDLHYFGAELNESITADLAQPEEEEHLGIGVLSEDAKTVLQWLLARGIQRGRAPGPISTAYWMGWSRDRMDDVWEELNCWWHNGGLPTEQIQLPQSTIKIPECGRTPAHP